MTPETFFAGSPAGLELFAEVRQVLERLGDVTVRVTKSEIAFRRRKGFAFLWRPGQYVRSNVPAVLSLSLGRVVASDRFKQIAHPSATVWMHHIELNDPLDVDQQVRDWLREAFDRAG